jgi:small subunit ribosomal protein S1
MKKNVASRAEFEALLKSSPAACRTGFHPGERVLAKVLAVGPRHLVLDVGAKNEGLAPLDDFRDGEGGPGFAAGDTVEVVFVRMEDGAFIFSPRLAGAVAVNQSLAQACASGLPVEGRVQGEINGGYEVTIGGRRAFCPYSQMSLFKEEEAVYVGRTFLFIVQEHDEEERSVVVSRRAVLEQERERLRERLREELAVGQTRSGRVTRLTDFGFFVDLGGVEGLVPLKEISWRRDVKPGDVVKEGDVVEVLVREVEWDRNRVSLSLRAAGADPFAEVAACHPPGSVLRGRVTHLERFGAFVEVAPGVEGLIPVGVLGDGRRITHPREVVAEGQEMEVRVESVDPERRRLSLRPLDGCAASLRPGRRRQRREEVAEKEAEEGAGRDASAAARGAERDGAGLGNLGELLAGLKL